MLLHLARPSLLLCLWLVMAPSLASHAISVTDPGQTPVVVTGAGNAELSGITHLGGGQFLAVADSGGTLHPVSIQIDPITGFVTQATASTPVVLAGAIDLEGVAWRSSTGTVWASDEVGPAIREFNPTTGALVSSITLPSVYANLRSNRGLESLSLSPDGSTLWTANEAALLVDGPVATNTMGTWVRIQRFDAVGSAIGQWAYLTEALFVAGVVDMVALPTGELLVLERGASGGGFEARLFLVDFRGATDVSNVAGLAGASFQGVGKTLLWRRITGSLNVEGISLGPALSGGDLSLVLVSDGAGTRPATTFALRLSIPEPGTLVMLVSALVGLLGRRAFTRSGGRGPGVSSRG